MHPGPLPQERENHSPRSGKANALDVHTPSVMADQKAGTATEPVELFSDAPTETPSPGGEGRGEGGRSLSTINSELSTEAKLRHMFAYNDEPHQFTPLEVDALIAAIDSLKTLDPAVGSGAFPMGILHKLVFILGKLDPRNEKWKERQIARVRDTMATAEKIEDTTARERAVRELEQQISGINEAFEHNELDYGRKLYLIENCIYGVDIQPIAVQIAKMRFFISLIVDQRVNQGRSRGNETQTSSGKSQSLLTSAATDWNMGVRPLPNLETKFVAANTLIGVNRPGQQLLRNREIDTKEGELRRVRERYFLARTPKQKTKCRDEDARLRAEIAELLKGDGWDTATARRLASWNPYDQNTSADFFDAEWMFGITAGFDVVVGNPPYEEISDKSQTEYFKKYYFEVLSGHYDLYIFFFRTAFTLARKGTTISFITPHTYLQYSQFQRLRTWLYNKCYIREITSRIEGVFESAVVDNAIIILSVGSAILDPTTIFSAKKIQEGVLLNVATKILPKSAFSDEVFDLAAIENACFIANLSPATTPLGDVVNSTQGITVYAKVQGEKIDHFRGECTDKACKPVTRGREINKYRLNWSGRFIRYGDWLWCPRNPKYFTSPKILLRQTADTLIGTFIEEPMYCIDSVHSLIAKPTESDYDLKFILGILNSKLGAYIYQKLICETGKVFAQVKLTFLRRFPIKVASHANQLKIVQLVNKILVAKQRDIDTDTLEREIDQQVYALYGLTPEEIRIVEGASK